MADETNIITLDENTKLRVTRVQIVGDLTDADGNTLGSPNQVAEISAAEVAYLGIQTSDFLKGKYIQSAQ